MENYNLNSEKGYDMPSKVKQLQLITLIERFQKAVSKFDGLTCEVTSKLQNIQQYSEPEPESNVGYQDETQSGIFVEEMHRLIDKVEKYNSRLEFNLRHLNEMI